MGNREKVINRLQILRTWCAVNPDYNMGLPVDDCVKAVGWLDDALALLKAQEPVETRVMTLEEYRAIAERALEERVPVWLEWRGGRGRWAIPERAYQGYGVNWRCWTGKPSNEQRRAETWT